MLMTQEGHTEIVKLLLAHNADITRTNGPGETALQVARRNERDAAAVLLETAAVNRR